MARHAIVEIFLLRLGRQFAVKKQVAGLEEVAIFSELFDRITAVQQNAFVTINVGDLGLTARSGRETRIVGERPRILVERADVDDFRPYSPLSNLEFIGFSLEIKRCSCAAHDNHLLVSFPATDQHRALRQPPIAQTSYPIWFTLPS